MANLGLLGAVGGLGQAFTQMGNDIVRRREQALEWAQREAERQRTEADHREDAATSFDRQMTLTDERERAADERQAAGIAAQDKRTALVQDREDRRQGRTIASQKELTLLRGKIARDNSEYAAKLGDSLKQDDVKGVQYGHPDKNGYAEVFVITNTGDVRSTGKKVFRPATTSQVMGGDDDNEL